MIEAVGILVVELTESVAAFDIAVGFRGITLQRRHADHRRYRGIATLPTLAHAFDECSHQTERI